MTLLELVVAMSLLVMLLGIGAISYASGHDERTVREATAEVEAMASRGHAMSVLHQKPFWIEVVNGRVILRGADILPPVDADSTGLPAWAEFGEQAENSNVVNYDEYKTDVAISIRRWGAAVDHWVYPEEDKPLLWQFQATGLCEPLSIRFEWKKSWIILHMHPLTARAIEEEMNIE